MGHADVDEHGRPLPPEAAPEREMLEAFLDFHRATLLWKVSGLTDEELRRPGTPSGVSLLGLVKHLADVEQSWFVEVFAGEPPEFPLWREDDPAAVWRIEPDETTAWVLDVYRRVCERCRAIVAAASAEDLAAAPRAGAEGLTLRWILVHMVEETARHNGHADIIREAIDGAVGE
jgi:uncharacterized damage-inducible protein DinB